MKELAADSEVSDIDWFWEERGIWALELRWRLMITNKKGRSFIADGTTEANDESGESQ